MNSLQLPLEGFVQDGRQQHVEFGVGLRLEVLQVVNFCLEGVKVSDDTALFFFRGNWN